MIKILLTLCALIASVSIAEARKVRHAQQQAYFEPLFQADWFSNNVPSSSHYAGAPRTTANFPPVRGRASSGGQMIPHPSGCPRRLFCGCGTAVEFFSAPVRSLWRAAAWLQFPRTSPSAGTAAIAPNRHHVVKVVEHVGGSNFVVIDHNSGRNRSRIHTRNLAGWTFVIPRG